MKTIEKRSSSELLVSLLARARIIRSKIKTILRRKKSNRHLNNPTVVGIPPGLERGLLDQVSLERFGAPLDKISYVHLSGWKVSGAYRVILLLRGGKQVSLIYKNAVYDELHIPALNGLPVRPGPPEYFLYKDCGLTDATILPAVYHIAEIVPRAHYQYLMEDLNREYRYVLNLEDKIHLAANLPAIHQRFCRPMTSEDAVVLIQYDYQYSLALQEYAWFNLQRYALSRSDPNVNQFLEIWPEISRIHGSQEFHEMLSPCLIHGDLNFTNIFINRLNTEKIKLIDWEWTGIGYLHADLASIMKGVPESVEKTTLDIFSKETPGLNPKEHSRMYYWCKLERNLLDAAFLAVHEMESLHPADFSIPAFIHNSLNQIQDAYQKLI